MNWPLVIHMNRIYLVLRKYLFMPQICHVRSMEMGLNVHWNIMICMSFIFTHKMYCLYFYLVQFQGSPVFLVCGHPAPTPIKFSWKWDSITEQNFNSICLPPISVFLSELIKLYAFCMYIFEGYFVDLHLHSFTW